MYVWDCSPDPFFCSSSEVVSYDSKLATRQLSIRGKRTKAEGNIVGSAGQAFSFVEQSDSMHAGYVMGKLVLPPKGIKDAEGVGPSAQLFTVVHGQPGAIEVAFADPEEAPDGMLTPETATRYLLGPGDMFRVPPSNCYRLQNHSKTTDCLFTWTIIRCRKEE